MYKVEKVENGCKQMESNIKGSMQPSTINLNYSQNGCRTINSKCKISLYPHKLHL